MERQLQGDSGGGEDRLELSRETETDVGLAWPGRGEEGCEMIKKLRTGMGSKSTRMRVAQGQRVCWQEPPPQPPPPGF